MKSISYGVIFAFLLSAGLSPVYAQKCNPRIAGAVGVVLGAIIGDKKGKTAEYALLGGAVGAIGCQVFNYTTKRLATREQINRGFKNRNGYIPDRAVVDKYYVSVTPRDIARSKSVVTVKSTIAVAGQRGVTVEEKLELIAPDGTLASELIKRSNPDSTSEGMFGTDFKFDLAPGIPQGKYTLRTTLYLSGEQSATNSHTLQVI